MKVFFNTQAVDSQNKFEKIGNLLLTPTRYLFDGKDYKYIDAKSLQYSPSFPQNKKTFLKTALAVILFIPSTILGALFKGLAHLSKETRDNSDSIKNYTEPKKPTDSDKKIKPPGKGDDPKPPPKKPEITVCKFSELDHAAQQEALEEIDLINNATSTVPGTNWNNYTSIIKDKLKCNSNVLFLARTVDRFIGYALFSKEENAIPYCFFVAVKKGFQGQGIGSKLEARIFNEQGVSAFTADVFKTNQASIKAFEGFAKRGFKVSRESADCKWRYTIAKPSVNEVPDDAHERSA